MKNGLAALATALALVPLPAARAGDEAAAAEVFNRRILPIFRSPDPSSCTQCHLSGVDLKNYILPSHEKTFLSLRDQGLIDLEKPDQSKILRLIRMGAGEKPSLIQEKVRKAEFEAFSAWIRASAADPALRDAPKLPTSELAKPKRPDEVIRHARTDRLLKSFEENVWSQRFRCAHCHMPGERDYARKAEEYGERMGWLKKEGPEASMDYLIQSKLIDLKQPARSLLLLKPLNEVKHAGGQKMRRGDAGYMALRTWLEDYAAVAADKVAKPSDLPKAEPAKTGTEIWLRLTNPPPAWKESLIQLAVHAWDGAKRKWSAEPVANTFATVETPKDGGKPFAHNTLFLLGAGATSLPEGRSLIKVWLVPRARLEGSFQNVWKSPELAGQAEIPDARWAPGYPKCTVFDAGALRR